MQNKFISLVSLFIFFTAASVVAVPNKGDEPTGTGPIYVVDIQKVLSESVAGKAARSNIEAEVKKSEARLTQLRLDIQKGREELEKQSGLLAEGALTQKQDSLEKKAREYERAVDDERASLDKRNKQEIEQIMSKVQKIVQELSSEEQYGMVVEKDPRLVIHVMEEFDLSDQVIKRLNKEVVDL